MGPPSLTEPRMTLLRGHLRPVPSWADAQPDVGASLCRREVWACVLWASGSTSLEGMAVPPVACGWQSPPSLHLFPVKTQIRLHSEVLGVRAPSCLLGGTVLPTEPPSASHSCGRQPGCLAGVPTEGRPAPPRGSASPAATPQWRGEDGSGLWSCMAVGIGRAGAALGFHSAPTWWPS